MASLSKISKIRCAWEQNVILQNTVGFVAIFSAAVMKKLDGKPFEATATDLMVGGGRCYMPLLARAANPASKLLHLYRKGQL